MSPVSVLCLHFNILCLHVLLLRVLPAVNAIFGLRLLRSKSTLHYIVLVVFAAIYSLFGRLLCVCCCCAVKGDTQRSLLTFHMQQCGCFDIASHACVLSSVIFVDTRNHQSPNLLLLHKLETAQNSRGIRH